MKSVEHKAWAVWGRGLIKSLNTSINTSARVTRRIVITKFTWMFSELAEGSSLLPCGELTPNIAWALASWSKFLNMCAKGHPPAPSSPWPWPCPCPCPFSSWSWCSCSWLSAPSWACSWSWSSWDICSSLLWSWFKLLSFSWLWTPAFSLCLLCYWLFV